MNLQEMIFKLIRAVIFFFIVILLISVYSLVITGSSEGYFQLEFCLSDSCLKNAGDLYGNVIAFFVASIQTLASVATALGIVVAALTFKNTSETNALNSHISHFKIFSDYLVIELNKRERISITSINTFDWYNLIFSRSIHGSVAVSSEYIEALKDIDKEIDVTNSNATKASQGPFRHHEHQSRMKKVFLRLGIQIEHYPKNDYWIIENEIISLIDSINQAFCQKPRVNALRSRNYIK